MTNHPEHETTINKFPTQGIHLCTYHYQNNQYQTSTTDLLTKYLNIKQEQEQQHHTRKNTPKPPTKPLPKLQNKNQCDT